MIRTYRWPELQTSISQSVTVDSAVSGSKSEDLIEAEGPSGDISNEDDDDEDDNEEGGDNKRSREEFEEEEEESGGDGVGALLGDGCDFIRMANDDEDDGGGDNCDEETGPNIPDLSFSSPPVNSASRNNTKAVDVGRNKKKKDKKSKLR